MTQERMNPLEEALRQVAAAAPQPWHPCADGKGRRAERERVTYLEFLRLDGLVQDAPGAAGGVVLSPLGQRVLQDPEALRRLRDGRPLVAGDRGGIVRQALRRYRAPLATRLLVGLNLLVFGYGAYLAGGRGALRSYLWGVSLTPRGLVGLPGVSDFLHRVGSVFGADLLRGEWWRLLSSAFVHVGCIHLGMNMYMLHRAGPMIEQLWGRLRYLAIYLTSAWLAGCLAVAFGPLALYQGASGAICGLLAAEAVWVVLNRRHLPASILRRARRAFVVNTLLLVGISLLGGVSGWGHGGGALGGALAAALLHFQRFGPPRWRWLALPALAAVPALGVWFVRHEQAVSPRWEECREMLERRERAAAEAREERELEAAYGREDRRQLDRALHFYNERVVPLLHAPGTPLPREAVEAVLREAPEQRHHLAPLIERLSAAGPFRSERVERRREGALRLARDLDGALRQAEELLRKALARAERAGRAKQ